LRIEALRSKFYPKDQENLKKDLSVGLKLHRNSLAAQMSVVLSSVAAGAKKLFGIASA
jgi:hypothetical protein